VRWKAPTDDGGAPVEHYRLEKRSKGSNKWQKVPGKIPADETQTTARNLDEGEEYEFRVIAVNAHGDSDPLVSSSSVKAKYPFGKNAKHCTFWNITLSIYIFMYIHILHS